MSKSACSSKTAAAIKSVYSVRHMMPKTNRYNVFKPSDLSQFQNLPSLKLTDKLSGCQSDIVTQESKSHQEIFPLILKNIIFMSK